MRHFIEERNGIAMVRCVVSTLLESVPVANIVLVHGADTFTSILEREDAH
jgi:hypothetical protein